MKIEDKHIVYFIGIGGIGMSALARWYMHLGKSVYGYDKTETNLTRKLINEGAIVHYTDQVANIPNEVLRSKKEVLVVYTPAIPKDHLEYNYLVAHDFSVLKRSEVLGLITNNLYSVAVAGTHGKTTTSSMIAHILKTAGRSSVSLMGGILQGYESNLIMQGEFGTNTIAVLEADEYDKSFLRLNPDIAVVTSADPDHLDIYGKYDDMKSSFKEFINRVKPEGHIYVNETLTSWLMNENDNIYSHSYSLSKGDSKASNVHISGSDFIFDFLSEDVEIPGIKLPVPGYHNVENAIAAISVSLLLEIDRQSIKSALACFKGVKRRFEYHIKNKALIYIDDYAHHPAEIKALLDSVKSLYPGKKITVVFQPHLYSRTRDFADGFAKSLDQADEVILMDIYPARELPLENVTSNMILARMENPNKKIVNDRELLNTISKTESDVFLTVGAGDIDRFIIQIKDLLENRI